MTVVVGGCRDSGSGVRPVDAGVDQAAPDLVDTPPRPEVNCAADALGGGQCPYNFCDPDHILKSVAALGMSEIGKSGHDELCRTNGNVCVAVTPTATGDAYLLTCVMPNGGALAYGAECDPNPAGGKRCKHDSLCIQAADSPGTRFCSALCRVDGDCPADSFCLDYKTAPLPNNSHALVGMCTPKAKITGTVCTSEKDCPANQGCARYGGHSSILVCKPGGAKSLGEVCANHAECRSGECYDRLFRSPSGMHRAACSGACAKNSDCGADQRCVRTVQANNGTPADPLDDVVVGYCQNLLVPLADDGCKTNKNCLDANAGDTCDVARGLCYTAGAAIGGSCNKNEDCGLGSFCSTSPRFRGGACLLAGCAPGAMTGVDSCPGANTVCAQRAADVPLSVCYERCGPGMACSRVVEGYVCGGQNEPSNICLFSSAS